MRLIIAGSRDITRVGNFERLLDTVKRVCTTKPSEIISGHAMGPDQWGEEIAAMFGIPVRQFIPNWKNADGSLNKGAGFIRNGDMAVYASEVPDSVLVAMWDGASTGTQQMIEVAKNYGLRVEVVYPNARIDAPDVAPPVPFIFAQSYSSLGVFDTCPYQYHAKYITKEVKYVQSADAKWGDDAHNALEKYVLTKRASGMPGNMAHYAPYADWVLDRAAKRGGIVMAERQAAVNREHAQTGYKAKDAWVRGKIDITILYPQERKAEVFDWKTGKIRNDATQLKLYDGFTLADYPEIDEVASGYIWLEHKQITPPVLVARSGVQAVWSEFDHRYAQLQDAYVRKAWPKRPNGLCKAWCDVLSCEHNGRNG